MDLDRVDVDAELAAIAATAPKVPYRPVGPNAAAHAEKLVLPDFALLFHVPDHLGSVEHLGGICPQRNCRRCEAGTVPAENCTEEPTCARCSAALTPRAAYLLHMGAESAGDQIWSEFTQAPHGQLAEDPFVVEHLPRLVLRWLDNATPETAVAWVERFIYTVDRIGVLLAGGFTPRPETTAEEMALHLVLDEAAVWIEEFTPNPADDGVWAFDPDWAALPEVDERDGDLDFIRETLFEDHHVLELFDPAFDDPGHAGSAELVDAHLEPGRWFDRFDEPV